MIKVRVNTCEIQEGFVYNYQTQAWYKYSLAKGEKNSAFLDTIQQDLSVFLKNKVEN